MSFATYTIPALASEITNDPASLGYATPASHGSDAGIAALLNDPSKGTAMAAPLAMLEFAKWSAANGVTQKLLNNQANTTFGAICYIALQMFSQLSITFDPNDSNTVAMMNGLVTAGVLASSDVTGAVTACTRAASRAENVWGPGTVVSISDVAASFGRTA